MPIYLQSPVVHMTYLPTRIRATSLKWFWSTQIPSRWRQNGHNGVSNHLPHCLLNRLVSCRSKKASKLRVTGLWAGDSPVTGEFPTQMASNTDNVSIWWCHHAIRRCPIISWVPSNINVYTRIFLHIWIYLLAYVEWRYGDFVTWHKKQTYHTFAPFSVK